MYKICNYKNKLENVNYPLLDLKLLIEVKLIEEILNKMCLIFKK